MNFEQTYQRLVIAWPHIRCRRAIILYLRYELYLLAGKRQKLKLGRIHFEIKEHRVGGFVLYEEVKIRYIRQDNTAEDAASLETGLAHFSGHWDGIHGLAALIMLRIMFIQVRGALYANLIQPGYYIFEKSFFSDYFMTYVLQSTIGGGSGAIKKGIYINEMLVTALIDLCSIMGIFI